MSSELINRITIKKDGVYISTHSSNDTSPYYSVKSDFLTNAYETGGQKKLDENIIDMCFNFCQLRGSHKSVVPYSNAIEKAYYDSEFEKIRKEYWDLENKAFYIANRFDEYKELTKEEANKMYEDMKPELKRLRDKRNQYVVSLVEKERKMEQLNNGYEEEEEEEL